MKNMGIREKIRLGFLALGLLLFFSGLISFFELSKLSRSTQSMLGASLKNMELSKTMLDAVQDQNTALLQIIVSGRSDRESDSLLHAGREKFEAAISDAKISIRDLQGFDSVYAARAGLDALVLEKLSAGGQMALTEAIDNYPGYEDGIDGFTLAEKMQRQAERFGARTEYAQVDRMDLTAEPKVLETSEGPFAARTVVLATGAGPRELGLAGEKALVGRGVAYCAACDGMRYKGRTVVVVGGGNSAAADALLLSRIAEKVILVHRRDQLRATKVYHAPLMQAENVEFRWNSTITELLHEGKLTGVRLKDVHTGAESILPCDGLFISVGRKPATELVRGQLELDAGGYVAAGETTETSLPGVYAAGDVRTKPLRQVVTAVADGAMAVHMAEEYLAGGAPAARSPAGT